tara:strand:+ start:44 stop:163 length:120 start_codon:yes stop_codon:yes gene_type:complete
LDEQKEIAYTAHKIDEVIDTALFIIAFKYMGDKSELWIV